jgi:hypothetical protein
VKSRFGADGEENTFMILPGLEIILCYIDYLQNIINKQHIGDRLCGLVVRLPGC